MKKITLNQNGKEIIFNLDVEEEITVKQLRKLAPLIQEKEKEGNLGTIDTVIDIVKVLSVDENVEETLDTLNLTNFNILSEEIANILNGLNTEKKTNKS